MRRTLWRQLRDYNYRGFHPDDRDTTALVDEWRRELFGERGALNHQLVASNS